MRPTLSKELGISTTVIGVDPAGTGHFSLRLTARLLRGARAQTFEISGYYMFHPLAAERMAKALPNAQIVALVRDPVERAYSAYRHEYARGFEDQGFADALALEDERTAGEAEKLASVEGYVSYAHRHYVTDNAASTQPSSSVTSERSVETASTSLMPRCSLPIQLPSSCGCRRHWGWKSGVRFGSSAGTLEQGTRLWLERDRLLKQFEPYDEALAQMMSQHCRPGADRR